MKSKILKYKKLLLGLALYLLFLGWLLFLYSGSPPDIDVEMYKGAPIGTLKEWSNVAQQGKADDLNIVRTTMFWMVDNEGNLHELPFIKSLISEHIQHAHRLGLKMYLSIRPQYGGFTGSSGVSEIPENLRPTFFSQFHQHVLEWAEICEKWGVELYAPIQESEVLALDGVRWENDEVKGDKEISSYDNPSKYNLITSIFFFSDSLSIV